MMLYLKAKTNLSDLSIDFIEVKLKSGKIVSLNWDETEYDNEDSVFEAKYKGVYFGEEYANGKLHELILSIIVGTFSSNIHTLMRSYLRSHSTAAS